MYSTATYIIVSQTLVTIRFKKETQKDLMNRFVSARENGVSEHDFRRAMVNSKMSIVEVI